MGMYNVVVFQRQEQRIRCQQINAQTTCPKDQFPTSDHFDPSGIDPSVLHSLSCFSADCVWVQLDYQIGPDWKSVLACVEVEVRFLGPWEVRYVVVVERFVDPWELDGIAEVSYVRRGNEVGKGNHA
jgi:hypothetical protein